MIGSYLKCLTQFAEVCVCVCVCSEQILKIDPVLLKLSVLVATLDAYVCQNATGVSTYFCTGVHYAVAMLCFVVDVSVVDLLSFSGTSRWHEWLSCTMYSY
jgi:hypothetical protein